MKNISIGIIRTSKYPKNNYQDFNDNLNDISFSYKVFRFNFKKSNKNNLIFTDFKDTKEEIKFKISNTFILTKKYQIYLLIITLSFSISYLFEMTIGNWMGKPFLLYYLFLLFYLYAFLKSKIDNEKDFIFDINKKSISYLDFFNLKHHLMNNLENVDIYIKKDEKNYTLFFMSKREGYNRLNEIIYHVNEICENSIVIKVPLEDDFSLNKIKENLILFTGKEIIDFKK